MAKILCVWEQGSNLGHLSNLRLPIETALQLGHQVFLAARELHRIPEVLGNLPIIYLQAPFKQKVVDEDQSAFLSFTHLIARQCFSSSDELEIYICAWRALFDLIQPELVLFEHSPTALIASRSYCFKKVLVGNGFTIPVLPIADGEPFGIFMTTPRSTDVLAALRRDDAVLLAVINRALDHIGVQCFGAMHEIYAQVNTQFLLTWPVLDHFGERSGQRYLGAESTSLHQGQSPHWPPGAGPKVFGYLQIIPSLEVLLRDLQLANVCALLYVHNLPPKLKDLYTSEHLRFTDHLLDLSQVVKQVDWVINHGNHSTIATFMRAGIPQLVIPRHQEQLFVALRLVAQGCVVMAYQDQPSFLKEITALVSEPLIKRRAVLTKERSTPYTLLQATDFIRHTFQVMSP